MKEKDQLEDLAIKRNIIIKLILNKWDENAKARFTYATI